MHLLRHTLLAATLALASLTTAVAQSSAHNASTYVPIYEDIFGHPLPTPKSTRVFGQKIVYYDIGSGPVLVLVHGYGSQADVDFGPVLLPLSKSHRVIALDEIGFGRSDKPFMEYKIQTYIDFLGEFLRTLHIQNFDLAGDSLGGWIAAGYTVQSLNASNVGTTALPKPSRLILEDAAGFALPARPTTPEPASSTLMVSTVAEVETGLAAVFYNKSLITPEVARRRFITKLEANDGISARTFRSNPEVANEAVGDKVSAISIPTLVVWGAEDKTVPITAGKAYAAAIPGAQFAIIEKSGHIPSLEQPQEFLKVVLPFLSH
jgi:pimeloyl-ACP methyl ester carboxylesterase